MNLKVSLTEILCQSVWVCVCVCVCVCVRARARVRVRERERASERAIRIAHSSVM